MKIIKNALLRFEKTLEYFYDNRPDLQFMTEVSDLTSRVVYEYRKDYRQPDQSEIETVED